MKVLALDIGAGTEDVLLFNSQKKSIENCIKMVLPSPSRVFAAKVREATHLRKNVLVKGDIIGGGAFSHALREHVEKGLRAVINEKSAYIVRNDLDEVRRLGFEIVKDGNDPEGFQGETLTVEEINLQQLQAFLTEFGETFSDIDVVAIAVQDHGVFPKGTSNRRFRLRKLRELLEVNTKPENLAFTEEQIPLCFLRMKSAAEASRRQLPQAQVLLMDTAPDAIIGCTKDPAVEKADPVLAVNLGNGHTMAAVISQGDIIGMMEHHTRLLTPQKIERLLVDFVDGKLTDEQVFKGNGHGLFYLKAPPGFSNIQKIAATGPNRNILSYTKLAVHFAAPVGDVMMTGPVGLVYAAKSKFS